MTSQPRADSTDDLLRHIAQGPGRDPDGYARTFERLHRDAPKVFNDRPVSTKR